MLPGRGETDHYIPFSSGICVVIRGDLRRAGASECGVALFLRRFQNLPVPTAESSRNEML